MLIASASNDRVKELKKLLKSSGARNERKCFVVEGIRMFCEIPADRIMEIYVAESAYEGFKNEIEKYGLEPVILTDRLFEGVSATGSPQGILALVRQSDYSIADVLGTGNPFVFILERLQDPGNMGTIIRTAEGAGATGIVVSRSSVDIYNPKVVRSTMGALFRVPIYISDDLPADIDLLKEKGVEIFGAHLSGKNIYESSFIGGCGFLIGNEGNGLSDEVSSTADKLIRIPMKGQLESLNAAASATVIGYEVLRQREYRDLKLK